MASMQIACPDSTLYVHHNGLGLGEESPVLLCIHGVLGDGSVWEPQLQALARGGFAALAPDLPGHARSTGEPPRSVEQAARSVWAVADAIRLQRVALVGHSWGSLIALHAAASAPERVSHVALLGTACPMRVAPALMRAALHEPAQALEMINTYAHAPAGAWHKPEALALMQRVLGGARGHEALCAGLAACDAYASGVQDMRRSTAPVCFVLGGADRMTPPQAAQSLIDAAGERATVLRVPDAGHSLMAEAPQAVLHALQCLLGADSG